MTGRIMGTTLLAAMLVGAGCDRAGTQADGADTAALPDSLSISGFETPESVLHDEVADVYLVSNINGGPSAKDDNGFISRVAPDGTVQQLRWIDGAAAEVTLHAPKGMAIIGDTLFVSDIDSVRAFHRTTGAQLGGRGVPGATFLNDLVAADGVLYVSDSGMNPDFSASGTDAVYRFDGDRAVALARNANLGHPNGIAAGPEGVIFVTFNAKDIARVPSTGGAVSTITTAPVGQFDGVIRLNDGSLLVSSWEANTVYHVDAQGTLHPLFENMTSPADIGFDARRQRVLIPLFTLNQVEIRRMP